MILLNFSHPLTAGHLAQVEALAGQAVARVLDVPVRIDLDRDLLEQVTKLADAAGLTATEWQTLPLLVNPPSLNVITLGPAWRRLQRYYRAITWSDQPGTD